MNQPTLGIVVPHYNQYETLLLSLLSLLKSEVDKRIVLVDDGSKRDVGIGALPPKIDTIRLRPNHGVQFARNMGYYALRKYGCEYTLFSDSDVIWCPGALDKLVNAIERSGEAYAYCDYGRGEPADWVAGEWDEKKLRSCNYISTMSVIRTAALEECGGHPFDESIERLQDWDLWLTLLGKGFRGTYVPEVLFHSKLLGNGISAQPGYQEAVNAARKKHGLL